MSRNFILPAFLLFAASVMAPAQQGTPGKTDGAILSQKPCVFGPYDQEPRFTKRFYTREDYDYARANPKTECFRVAYSSDGLRVVGYLVRPIDKPGTRLPVIIFNRGGFLERGKIQSFNLVDFEALAEQGFVVLASQYRGNDGGEGHEELGGADLDDVSNLQATARSLPYTDTRNIFMYGVSRGGMMTLLEMKRSFPMNAAAIVGGAYDVAAFNQRSPGVLDEITRLIPGYSQNSSSALQERSAMNWPEVVNVPLLILHGTDDDEVPTTEALAFATKLSTLKKLYQMVVYAGDVHEVAENRRDRDARVAQWFKRYMR
jgi:dipeptidyl aminopeptidase/acylaminoacyl peptidase